MNCIAPMVVWPSGAEKKSIDVVAELPKTAVPVGMVVDQLEGSCQSPLLAPVQIAFCAYAAVAPSNVPASTPARTRRDELAPTTNTLDARATLHRPPAPGMAGFKVPT